MVQQARLPMQAPMDLVHVSRCLGEDVGWWQDPRGAWPQDEGRAWAGVLGMALPVIDRVDLRVRREGLVFRGQSLCLGGAPGVLLQRRVRQGQSSPWLWVALEAIGSAGPNPAGALPFFIDVLADRFRGLEGRALTKALPDDRLASALSGPAWAVLTGRARAVDIF